MYAIQKILIGTLKQLAALQTIRYWQNIRDHTIATLITQISDSIHPLNFNQPIESGLMNKICWTISVWRECRPPTLMIITQVKTIKCFISQWQWKVGQCDPFDFSLSIRFFDLYHPYKHDCVVSPKKNPNKKLGEKMKSSILLCWKSVWHILFEYN